MELLTVQSCGQGRVFLGHATKMKPNAPILVFVHGRYHGAWCFAHYLKYFDEKGIPAAAVDMHGHGGLKQNTNFHQADIGEMARPCRCM